MPLDLSEILAARGDREPTMREVREAHREFLREHPAGVVIRTETMVLTRVAAREPEIVDRARESLVMRAQAWVERTGHEIVQVTWETDPPAEHTELVTLRMTAYCVERTDGEWPSVHQARREDEADREAAKKSRTAMDDRLDALAAGATYWADRDLRGL